MVNEAMHMEASFDEIAILTKCCHCHTGTTVPPYFDIGE